jgi:hypothetical protein
MRKGSVCIGEVFGRLTVIDKIGGGAGKHQRLICECSCGTIRDVDSHNIKLGKHCGCLVEEKTLVGKFFGKIKVIELLLKNSEMNGKKRGHLYKCKCNQCGKEHKYPTNAILKEGFLGCRCVLDTSKSSKTAIYCNYRCNARNRNVDFELSFDDFVILAERNCFYCGVAPSNKINSKELIGEWEYNGVDRINNDLGYNTQNTVTCCKKCNFMKKNLNVNDFIGHINKIFNNLTNKQNET